MDFSKILKVASITVVIKKVLKETSRKMNLLSWMRKDALQQ